MWNDATYDIFEKRCILPVADWSDECCFVAIRESFVQQLLVKGSSWGEQLEDNPEEKAKIRKQFLTQCGARLTSKDVHWPMQLSMRVAPGPLTRASARPSDQGLWIPTTNTGEAA